MNIWIIIGMFILAVLLVGSILIYYKSNKERFKLDYEMYKHIRKTKY